MSNQGQRSMKTVIKIVLGIICLDLVLKVKYSEILIFNAIFLCQKPAESQQKISLKNTKMRDKLLLIPYSDILIFNVLYFVKICPNFEV